MSGCTCGHRPDHHTDEGCTGHIIRSGRSGRCPCGHSAESAAQVAHPDQLDMLDLLEGDPS